MSIAFYQKSIHCPNCNYEGKAKVKGTGSIPGIFGVALLILGFWFFPLFFISILCFTVAVFMPAKQICPKCNFEYPIPISQWNLQHNIEHNTSDFRKPTVINKNSLAYKLGRMWKLMTK